MHLKIDDDQKKNRKKNELCCVHVYITVTDKG